LSTLDEAASKRLKGQRTTLELLLKRLGKETAKIQ
jgi:hypothetical protein